MIDTIFTGAIPFRIQVLAILAGVLLFLFIVELIRAGRLKEGYALVWLSIAIVTLAFALYPGLLANLAALVGISYAPSAFLLVLVSGSYLLSIHFALLLHRYDQRIRRLAQEHAMLKEEVERKHKSL